MHELRQELAPRVLPFPRIQAGDAVEVMMLPFKTAPAPEALLGVALKVHNKGNETSVLLRDVMFGEVIEREIKLSSPLVQSVKILQKAHITGGKKRVRQSRAYYVRDLDPAICKISRV